MTAVLRGLAICLVCLLALASGAARAGEQPASGDARRGCRRSLAAPSRHDPLARRAGRTTADDGVGTGTLAHTIATTIPHAQIRWRYRLVANGMAVVLPRSQLGRLTALAGVTRVYPSVRYRTAARPQHSSRSAHRRSGAGTRDAPGRA